MEPRPANEFAPLVVLVVLGILTGGGWMIALREGPPPEAPPEEATLRPSPLPNGRTPHDEAMEAIAAANEQGAVRCAVSAPEGVRWPLQVAHHADGVLRAVVPTDRGSRLIWPPRPEGGERGEPVGLLRWSGAARGEVGGCELVPTGRTRIEGSVTVDGNPATDVRVRVCGETHMADAEGRFEASAWAGEHCLAYVSEPGITQDFAPIEVPMKGPAKVTLKAARVGAGSSVPRDRRLVVKRTSLPDRALRTEGLSDAARALLQEWSRASMDAEVLRTQIEQELDDLAPEAAEGTPSPP
ncbi:MAG: hypothetical protein R3F61_28970 [Myxococcota bacterium]